MIWKVSAFFSSHVSPLRIQLTAEVWEVKKIGWSGVFFHLALVVSMRYFPCDCVFQACLACLKVICRLKHRLFNNAAETCPLLACWARSVRVSDANNLNELGGTELQVSKLVSILNNVQHSLHDMTCWKEARLKPQNVPLTGTYHSCWWPWICSIHPHSGTVWTSVDWEVDTNRTCHYIFFTLNP